MTVLTVQYGESDAELEQVIRDAQALRAILDDVPSWLSLSQLDDSVAELREDAAELRGRRF